MCCIQLGCGAGAPDLHCHAAVRCIGTDGVRVGLTIASEPKNSAMRMSLGRRVMSLSLHAHRPCCVQWPMRVSLYMYELAAPSEQRRFRVQCRIANVAVRHAQAVLRHELCRHAPEATPATNIHTYRYSIHTSARDPVAMSETRADHAGGAHLVSMVEWISR